MTFLNENNVLGTESEDVSGMDDLKLQALARAIFDKICQIFKLPDKDWDQYPRWYFLVDQMTGEVHDENNISLAAGSSHGNIYPGERRQPL
ncbi:MAG: hypothetical protein Q8N08_00295 [Methanobacteriaceae archaeon]|nr:hypothetical protein [Methanobacteriaceae archaeon]